MLNQTSIHPLVSEDFVAVTNLGTVGGVIKVLRERKEDFQAKFAYVYVTDAERKLMGVLRIRDLLSENETRPIKEVMNKPVIQATENMSLEEVVHLFRTYSFLALPVTDQENHLIGVIPIEKMKKYLIPMPHQYRFAGLVYEEVENKSVWEIVLKRLPWFLISVTSGLVCAYILGIFIGKIESIVALMLFVPIILGLAGNVGTQSAQVTLRGLQEGKLSIRKMGRILTKEILTSVILGSVSFLLAFLIALPWRKNPIEGIALGISIIAVMTFSGALGIVLPIIFRIFRINSNFASGLLLLIICDIVAIVLYFTISLSLITPMLELG
ncbi:MAG: magnesium transporter [Candidatus Omnitrophica bacterium]|nr:magnesium transporter [Candidatus Omnitrophota bacterium]